MTQGCMGAAAGAFYVGHLALGTSINFGLLLTIDTWPPNYTEAIVFMLLTPGCPAWSSSNTRCRMFSGISKWLPHNKQPPCTNDSFTFSWKAEIVYLPDCGNPSSLSSKHGRALGHKQSTSSIVLKKWERCASFPWCDLFHLVGV